MLYNFFKKQNTIFSQPHFPFFFFFYHFLLKSKKKKNPKKFGNCGPQSSPLVLYYYYKCPLQETNFLFLLSFSLLLLLNYYSLTIISLHLWFSFFVMATGKADGKRRLSYYEMEEEDEEDEEEDEDEEQEIDAELGFSGDFNKKRKFLHLGVLLIKNPHLPSVELLRRRHRPRVRPIIAMPICLLLSGTTAVIRSVSFMLKLPWFR